MADYLIKDGASQEERILPALAEGYFNVDEKGLADLLAMAAEYGQLLTFYNLANRADGDWQPFFTSDETVIFALILTTDLQAMETSFFSFLNGAGPLFSGEGGDPFLLPTFTLVGKIDFWFSRLKTMEGGDGAKLAQSMAVFIKEQLREQFHLLLHFFPQSTGLFRGKMSSLWFDQWQPERMDHLAAPREDKSVWASFLKANFYVFYKAVFQLQQEATFMLPASLKTQNHPPATALYIAFSTLFQKVQEQLNTFTGRHLDLYFRDILRARPRISTPDSAWLVISPDGGRRRVVIEKGTIFSAGTDDQKKEIIFTADSELLVHNNRVAALCTLFVERDPLSFPENVFHQGLDADEKQFATGVQVIKIPVAGELSEGEAIRAWPVLGAPKGEGDQLLFEHATLGFALASPVLFLKEGERTITLSFVFESASSSEAGLLTDFLEKLAQSVDPKTTIEDAFFKAFTHLFTISLTTASGWYENCVYLPQCRAVNKDYPNNRLSVQLTLSGEVEAIVAHKAEVHGGLYNTDLPVIRFLVNPQAYLYPSSLLEDIIIREIEVEAEVTGVRDVLVSNNLGKLDPHTNFQPFGPLPAVGSYFIVGNQEITRKHLSGFQVNVHWAGLPVNVGFEEYYQAYAGDYDRSAFEARVSVLMDGKWSPIGEKEQLQVKLFAAEPLHVKADKDDVISTKQCFSCDRLVPFFKSTAIRQDSNFDYTVLSKSGFFKFSLTGPGQAFGHQDYPAALTSALTANARLKKLKYVRPVPNPPYTPLIETISIDYQASSRIRTDRINSVGESDCVDTFYHIHPFGIQRLKSTSTGKIRLLPRIEADANLFIGLTGEDFAGVITLYFHLRNDALAETAASPCRLDWFYLSDNHWKSLSNRQMISDTTKGFLTSGIVTLDIPADINRGNSVMPAEYYWLRVRADRHGETLCSVYSVHAQALKVTRQPATEPETSMDKRIPAGTIKEPRKSITGINSVIQIGDSFGGSSTENRQQFNTRISERLRHKMRATVPWDYERLILERFPQIFKVKCFANMVADLDPEKRSRPGQVLIVVIPNQPDGEQEHMRPMANRLLLREIQEWITQHSSPFSRIVVRSPSYEQIQIRCTVVFRGGSKDGFYIKKLNQSLNDYLSPWKETGAGAQFGWCLRSNDIISFIRNLDFVDFMTNFSMLHIADSGKGTFRLFDTVKGATGPAGSTDIEPLYPWSIAIPVSNHFIEFMESEKSIEPEITGINELEVGSTFILSGE